MRKIANWLDAYSVEESIDILKTVALMAAEAVTCEEGQQLARLIRKDDLLGVCKFQVPVDGSITAEQVRYLRQAVSCFSKFEELDLGIDKEQVAMEALLDAESHCRTTNAIWGMMHAGEFSFTPRVMAVFHLAQGHIQRILGPRPTLDELGLRFGPGATSLTKKRESSVKRKLGKGVSCSEDLVGWARALLGQMPHLAELHAEQSVVTEEEFWGVVPVVLHTGAISFVRKNYKTDRTTETQPTLNGMFQLGIGDEMLMRASCVEGLDLRDQKLNQRLAKIGSLTGEVATLDLKSSSNYIAVRLVQSLYPEDWYSMLKAARCGKVRLPGGRVLELEMFSGMGNGFTFPLQSVLFYALARASATVLKIDKPIVAVYGDDLIVDTALVPFLMEVLGAAGLVVNTEKSYFDGPFRESCGADFLTGFDVRPVYVKKMLTPAVLFSFYNGLIRKKFHDLAGQVLQYMHPDVILWGPDGYGDGHLITEDKSLYAKRANRHLGHEGFTFNTYATSSKKDWTYHPGDRILHTYAIYRRGKTDLLDNRRVDDDWDTEARESVKDPMESWGDTVPSFESRFQDPVTHVTVRRPWGDFSFIRAWATGHGNVAEPSLPIAWATEPRLDDDGPDGVRREAAHWGPYETDLDGIMWQGRAKATTFPGVDGYRKVKIYTLGE